ncbi:MAG: recombinase family protein [Proteobacteria bacterium]|nr:recombinase family protein [Pseudomonadota bacterium]
MNNAAIGYARVSLEEQKLHGMSLPDQEEKIRAYALTRDIEVVRVITEDVSGGKFLQERAGGQELLGVVRKKDVGHVISCKLDRIFRDTVDALTLARKWNKQGVALHLIDMGGASVDTSTAAGEFLFTTLAGAANFERNRISERTREALQYRKNHRLVYCRFAPYGWRKYEKRLIEVPQEQAIIDQIRAWRSEEKPLAYWRIAERLNAQGVPTKNGGKRWYMSTVKYVLDRSIIG